MPQGTKSPSVIVIGAGPSGIAFAHTLRQKLGFSDFTVSAQCNDRCHSAFLWLHADKSQNRVYEKLDNVGGTWRTNTYPGVGCDVPTILYSFSFNLNPSWSKELCDGPEILKYMEATVDKFDLRKHMQFSIECLGAERNSVTNQWDVSFRDIKTGLKYTRSATVFVSAVGGISYRRDVKFPGMETFKGEIFHSARWNHNYDYQGKRMAVIGNGCSAAQIVPCVVKKAAFVKQYARSAQWYHERPNRDFTSLEKWCFKNVPLWERYLRLKQFLENDDLVTTYMPGGEASKKRAKVEEKAKKYIFDTSPEKYHHFLVPDFPLGCKRRIFDPDYLESLHDPKLELVPEGILSIDETGITSSSGVRTEVDVIVLATGFQVQRFLTPMEVIGKNGIILAQQWKEHRGAQAYMGSYVHNFPNFAILFGPNTFPAHNSALFSCEVQIEYVARTMIAPIIDGRASVIEVKDTAENQWVNSVQHQMRGSVFEAGCSNWYINEFGRNAASWPGFASAFWKETLIPRRGIFVTSKGSKLWMLNTGARWLKTTSNVTYAILGLLLGIVYLRRISSTRISLRRLFDKVQGSLTKSLSALRS